MAILNKIKILLLFLVPFLIFSFVLNKNGSKEENMDHVKNINYSKEIKISSQLLAYYTPGLIAPYKTMDVFLSPEETADFSFTSAAIYWEQNSPQGTNVEANIRFFVNEKWSEWLSLDEETEKENGNISTKFTTASSNPAQKVQYKFVMYGDGIKTPTIKNVQLSLINAAAQTPKFGAAMGNSSGLISLIADNSSGVISRKQWSANEDYRYLENNDTEVDLIKLDPDWYDKYADELKYSRVVEEDENGKTYKWPLQYPEKVTKFVIHHTATTSNLDNPAQAIRDIYYYHAITRGWGDIGYNYIMDPQGKIYEGRYGGESVIGAHAGPGNHGSIGISVLGNYEENSVPEEVIVSLSKFIATKSKIHDIDPLESSEFRGDMMPNVFGHGDIMSTDCPGVNLYEKLPVIRSLASELKNETKPKFVKDYDYQDLSDIYYLELKPNETKDVIVKMENIGKQNWDSKTFLVVNDDPAFKDVISFPNLKDVSLATMQPSTVKSGETATFKFQIKAGKKGETVYLNLAPVIDGEKKIDDYKVIPVVVQQSDYKYELVDSKFPETAMQPGQQFTGWVKLKNKGNITWTNSGETKVILKTDHDRDRTSAFVSPASNGMGTLQESEVAPGKTGTFTLNLTAPQTPGFYKEYFTPYVENGTWMADTGMYFETTVFGGQYAAEVYMTSTLTDFERGRSYNVWMKLRNLGSETWTKDNMKLVFLKEQDLQITEAKLETKQVAPGELGTINFIAKVDPNDELGEKTMMVRPKVNGNHLLNKPIYFHYVVKEKSGGVGSENTPNSSNYAEGKIRVKLSFSGNPEISGSGLFTAYSGKDTLGTLNKDGILKVKMESEKYRIELNGKSFLKPDLIRIGPASGTILRIDNYEEDNEFRGILEVQIVDGELNVINELPLEDYMKGIGEEPNAEPYEKIKAVMVAARSYAKYYVDIGEKFPGKPYDLSDDPATSQKYIGYGFEKRAPNVVRAVEETKGEVVFYGGELVKTPYFSSSDGVATKSALDVWNWDAPFLVSVSDSYCKNKAFAGHGVGLSGCGARGMAEAGFTYQDILKHYYTGIDIVDLY